MHDPEPERRSRLLRRRWRPLALGAVVIAMIVAPAAWANHQFSDVTTASPHHEDISAIASARITGGCGPGLYCPADPVRRDQMASFLRRGLGRTTIAGTMADVTLTGSFQSVQTTSITTGGTTGGTGVVLATGDFTAFAGAGALGDAAVVEFRLVQDGGGQSSLGLTTLYPAVVVSTASASKTWFFPADTGVNETFHLQARLVAAMAGDFTDVSARSRTLTLLYVPFG